MFRQLKLILVFDFAICFQNAFSFGSARPPLHFHWSVSNQEVGDVVSVFHRSGVTNVNTGVTRFVAKKPGRVVLKLRVAITSRYENIIIQIC